MENRKVLLLGNGGHCRSVVDSIISQGYYTQIGIVERNGVIDSKESKYLIGTDDDLPSLYNSGWTDAVITVGSIGNTQIREKLYAKLIDIGFKLPPIIDPSAIVAKNVIIAEGVFIGKRTVINSNSIIGTCSIINTGSIIEHDCDIGSFVHVSPGATVCGEVCIGNHSHIGAGAVVREMVRIGQKSLIGAGSVVVKSIPDKVIAFGNPCRIRH